ncbi:MAG: glycosyltransferase [Steroidobacteraceae bacterium]
MTNQPPDSVATPYRPLFSPHVLAGSSAVSAASKRAQPRIAVLLPTYNGARYVEEQVASLARNCASFTLHWLDDHSTDNTREVVRSAALRAGIELREWHQPNHVGYPSCFYQLLECADADIYLYCDQDDIWQPGKIDATAANLLGDLATPALCFSDSLMFYEEQPQTFIRLSKVFGVATRVAMRESQSLFPLVCAGHSQGLTRPLRDILLTHKEIACKYSFAHDLWTYLIAVVTGTTRMLSDVPVALYRRHTASFSEFFFSGKSAGKLWGLIQTLRLALARHAQGFLLASETLPQGAKLERLVAIARLAATIDRRQPPTAMIRLMRRGALWPSRWLAISQTIVCLLSDAASPPTQTLAHRDATNAAVAES